MGSGSRVQPSQYWHTVSYKVPKHPCRCCLGGRGAGLRVLACERLLAHTRTGCKPAGRAITSSMETNEFSVLADDTSDACATKCADEQAGSLELETLARAAMPSSAVQAIVRLHSQVNTARPSCKRESQWSFSLLARAITVAGQRHVATDDELTGGRLRTWLNKIQFLLGSGQATGFEASAGYAVRLCMRDGLAARRAARSPDHRQHAQQTKGRTRPSTATSPSTAFADCRR